MEISHPSIILISGFIIDLFIGDPNYGYHPVRVIGNCINLLHQKLKNVCPNSKLAGVCLTIMVILFSVSVYSGLYLLFNKIHPIAGFLLNVYFIYSLIALKDLFNHCRPVIDALRENDLDNARKSIAMIVGRDVNYLDEAGVVRAAVETLAENFVDGFLSPVFWYAAGCLAGAVVNINPVYLGVVFLMIFKVASTLDSMVGYKTEEFKETGWAGARLDDLMNFIPARLSLIILFPGAVFSGLDPLSGLRTSMRDRLKHESPNSAHSESFVAGTIRARLGGPTRYSDSVKEKPWLGEEFPDPDINDIRRVMKLVLYSSWITAFVFSMIVL
ncbi:MAG: adenosylcobinamide-phosphate synthase CbiB [Desulfobacteraceae bacterium]|jgi:adenosylcobinamide-phosphate synthase